MKKIRIGHIGTKHDHSQDKINCVSKFPELFEVVGIVEEDEEQLARIKENPAYNRYPIMTEEQLLNAGCDCIMVEGFELDLPYVAKRCVEQGIAVHVDKPAGLDLQVFEDTLRLAKKSNIPVQMAYMYRYNPAYQDCLRLIKEGRLGDIHSISAIMNTGHPDEKRKWLKNFEAGSMFFLGCHMVDFVYNVQGTPDKITTYSKSSNIRDVDAKDLNTVIFEYPSGLSIIQSNSCEVNGFGRRELVVCGSEGTYEIHPLERPIGVKFTERSYAEPFFDKHTSRNIQTVPIECRYDEMMLDFAKMVRGEKANPYSYEYELQLQKLVLASCGQDIDYKAKIIL